MLRIGITTLFLILAGIIIDFALQPDRNPQISDLLLNFGTEIAGIVLTVAIVEWLFERQQNRSTARRLAWNVLLELDRAVWVWQGGKRELNINELLGLLSAVREDDPLPDFTQNYLMDVANLAQMMLQFEFDYIERKSEIGKGFESLLPVLGLRDEPSVSPRQIAHHLSRAVQHLAAALKIPISPLESEVIEKLRSPSLEKQTIRNDGRTSKV